MNRNKANRDSPYRRMPTLWLVTGSLSMHGENAAALLGKPSTFLVAPILIGYL